MHDLNLEYWQAFYYFCFGFALPSSIELLKLGNVKMWNLEACLRSGISHLLV